MQKTSDGLVLRPWYDKLEVKGIISYDNNARSWNTIRVRKEVITQFPQLKEKRSKFGYKMVFYKSYEELKKAVEKIIENKEPLPLFLYFIQEKIYSG